MLALATEASLSPKQSKIVPLEKLRISIEIQKHLVRAMQELEIIDVKNYLKIQEKLQEISKMANGWIRYIARKEP